MENITAKFIFLCMIACVQEKLWKKKMKDVKLSNILYTNIEFYTYLEKYSQNMSS